MLKNTWDHFNKSLQFVLSHLLVSEFSDYSTFWFDCMIKILNSYSVNAAMFPFCEQTKKWSDILKVSVSNMIIYIIFEIETVK